MRALFLTNPKDDRQKLENTKGSRANGTCEWIKANELYDLWLHSPSQLLWVSGGPGMGKSMIAIFLAQELEQMVKDSRDSSFLQYFCDNKDKNRNTAVTILRGLIYQTLELQPKLIHHILPSFKVQKESFFSFETLWRIFQNIICDPILGTIYCVLDGLDECEEDSLEMLLKEFAALFLRKGNRSSAYQLNLIILSRDLPEFIPHILSSFPRIRLDPDAKTEVNKDIQQFINLKVNELSVRNEYSRLLSEHVKEVFQRRAQGTFLWIGIVAKELEKVKATQVKIALEKFPAGLDGLYARMLLQISDDRREMAARILRWVVMAIRPLTIPELSVAVEPTMGTSVDFGCEQVMKDLVSYCGHFLTIKENEVNLIHQSAKDYLLRKTCDSDPELEVFRVKEKAANLEIARKCFYYLQSGALADGPVDLETNTAHSKLFPLLSYAALYWPEHSKTLDCSEDIFNLSLPFYSKKSKIRELWLMTYWANSKKDNFQSLSTPLHVASYFGISPLARNLLLKRGVVDKVKRFLDLNKINDALILAARGGHETVVRLLLKKGADAKSKDSFGKTALILAARINHEVMMRLLLEKGADIEAKGNNGWTALIWAANYEHEAVVQLLLEKGANLEAKDNDGCTALIHAALKHEAVVQLLLEKGANVEAKDNDGRTSLIYATFWKNEAVVQLLLEKGANFEAKGGQGWTALIWASRNGHEAMVRLLLEKGANIEAKDDTGWTALIHAATVRHEAMVQLLLEKGAKIEAKCDTGWTALISASDKGHEAVGQQVLEKVADFEAKNNSGGTALISASRNRHKRMVQLLLEKGADIEAKDNDELTALIWASRNRDKGMVQLLLKKGANIEAKDNDRWTVLIWASHKGYEEIVLLLLQKGANIEAKDNDGWTALIWASRKGHKAIVQLLLEKGANIEAKDNDGWTALIWASRKGHKAIVQLLLEKGANIEAKDNDGWTALIWASRNRDKGMVQQLLEKGANIEAKTDIGWTALISAADKGHKRMVQLLLEKGADIEAKNNSGRTALIRAAMSEHEAIVQLLLEKGADIEAMDNDGWTALTWAFQNRHKGMVQLLREKGANIEAMDNNRKTPAVSGHEKVSLRLMVGLGMVFLLPWFCELALSLV